MIFKGPSLESSVLQALLDLHFKSEFHGENSSRPGVHFLIDSSRLLVVEHLNKSLLTVRDVFDLPNLEIGEMVRFNHYHSGSSYFAHLDKRTQDSEAEVSVVFSLNDDYEGGDIKFADGTILRVRAGEFVAFRGDILRHEVLEVTSGIKRSLIAHYSSSSSLVIPK